MEDQTRQQLTAVLTIGADRPTAAAYCGMTLPELETEIAGSEQLTREVARAEATAELKHLRTVHAAAEDPKNWRASVWWLRSRMPDRYGRKPDTVTNDELTEFAEQFFAAVADELDEENLDRVKARVDRLLAQNPKES